MIRKYMLKVIILLVILCIFGCFLFDEKWVAAPVSITPVNNSPGNAYVTWQLDFSGNVYPSYVDVYYSQINDISTASVAQNKVGYAAISGLSSGNTYYFWGIAHGQWTGIEYYSQPTGPSTLLIN